MKHCSAMSAIDLKLASDKQDVSAVPYMACKMQHTSRKTIDCLQAETYGTCTQLGHAMPGHAMPSSVQPSIVASNVIQVAALEHKNMQRHPTLACHGKAAHARKAAQARIAGLTHDNAMLAVKLNTQKAPESRASASGHRPFHVQEAKGKGAA
jgi:hypothetical protein